MRIIETQLSIVVFPDDYELFPAPPAEYFHNRRVQVTGRVKEYQGAPEIIVESPEQIQIVGESPEAITTPEPKESGKTIPEILTWQDAGEYVGQMVTIEGMVVRSYDSGNVTFLNFSDNWRGTLSIVIFASDYDKFPDPPASLFLEQTVRVSGRVKEYQGAPEIVVESPDQIEIIDQPQNIVVENEPTATAEAPTGIIPWQEAGDYLGQVITVSGRIVRANDTGTITFLNFSNKRDTFVAVVFSEDYGNFPETPVSLYDGKEIWITGKIDEYNGTPQIVIRSPDQVEVFE